MRIAVLSDIHGNLLALQAVLSDLATRRVDLTVNLGDMLSGPLQPAETADLLMSLDMTTIRGNHERQLLTLSPDRMGPSDAYAQSQLRDEHRSWLDGLPVQLTIDDVLLCHGTPESDVEYLLETVEPSGLREASDEEVEERAGACRAPLILCGHTHLARRRRLDDGRLVVNPGSVGLPAYEDDRPHPHIVESGSPSARYAIVEPGEDGTWNADLISVDYDHEQAAVAAECRARSDWARALRTGRM